MERKITVFGNSASRDDNFLTVTTAIDKSGEGASPLLIIFFSDHIDFQWYSIELNKKYPDAIVLGSTSCDVICSDRQSSYGISLLAVMSEIECYCGIIRDVSTYPMQHVDEVRDVINKLDSYENSVIFEMVPSFSMCEELVLDTFNEAIGNRNIPLFGGSTGTEAYDGEEYVSLNGRIYTDSCVYVLIHNLNGRIFLYKENMYKPTDKIITATDVDCDKRIIYECNNKPVLTAMAEAFGVKEEEVEDYIFKHPLGRIRDNDIDIMDPAKILEDGAILYYARVFNYTRMAILEIDNLELVWRKSNTEIKESGIKPDFFIGVNCGLRSKMFKKLDKMDSFVRTLNKNYGDYICCSSFGEQLNGCHYNETMIIGLFE